MDNISEVRLSFVYPKLADAIRQMAQMFALQYPDSALRVTQGLRTWSEQALLYAQGRTLPGAIVTDAEPGYSWHNFGLAVDVVPMTALNIPDWNTGHPQWQYLITVGLPLGLVAGARFRTFKDYPHFQMTGRFPETPDDEARQILQNEGMQAFWSEAFALETGKVI